MTTEISILLKDVRYTTLEEFRILDQFASQGRIWTMIYRRDESYHVIKRGIEYIFEPDSFLVFKIISQNILVQWYTENTRYIRPGQEFQLQDELFIRLHQPQL